jgi:hypothetical protein
MTPHRPEDYFAEVVKLQPDDGLSDVGLRDCIIIISTGNHLINCRFEDCDIIFEDGSPALLGACVTSFGPAMPPMRVRPEIAKLLGQQVRALGATLYRADLD